ncbi:unnamed protein product, partial [marine sediment metagenome]
MAYLDWIIRLLSHVIVWLGLSGVIAIMLLVVANVIGRIFDTPVEGTFEVVELLGGVAIASVLAYTTIMKHHISVKLVV